MSDTIPAQPSLYGMDFAKLESQVALLIRGYNKPLLQERFVEYVWLDDIGRKPWDPLMNHEAHFVSQAHIPDWKHPIPSPDPTGRGHSCPSEKVRARLRAKRKKRT